MQTKIITTKTEKFNGKEVTAKTEECYFITGTRVITNKDGKKENKTFTNVVRACDIDKLEGTGKTVYLRTVGQQRVWNEIADLNKLPKGYVIMINDKVVRFALYSDPKFGNAQNATMSLNIFKALENLKEKEAKNKNK